MTNDQLAQLGQALTKGAEHHGFPGHIWIRPRVNEIIKRLFGVSYDPSQVGLYLRKWNGQDKDRSLKPASKTQNGLSSGETNA